MMADEKGNDAKHPVSVMQVEALLPHIMGALPQPWSLSRTSPVCRAWHALGESRAEFWAELVHIAGSLTDMFTLITHAGTRLRRLNLSGACPELCVWLPEGLLACPALEQLNLAGCEHVSFEGADGLCAALQQSLRYLNVRGCYKLLPNLPALLGANLRHLEAGWDGEHDSNVDLDRLSRSYPRRLFHHIAERCPALQVLRVPGYILLTRVADSRGYWAVQEDFHAMGRIASLASLRRLDLCCAQVLHTDIARETVVNCSRLRSINFRACQDLQDGVLEAIAEHLAEILVHINISCCIFSEGAVRMLITRCALLKTLDLCYCDRLSVEVVRFLVGDRSLCPRLRMLGVGGLDVGDAEVRGICEKYSSSMTHLGIGSALRLTDNGLLLLGNLPKLTRLSAHRLPNVTSDGLLELCRRCKALVALDASDTEAARTPTPALGTELAARPYSYNESDSESDAED